MCSYSLAWSRKPKSQSKSVKRIIGKEREVKVKLNLMYVI